MKITLTELDIKKAIQKFLFKTTDTITDLNGIEFRVTWVGEIVAKIDGIITKDCGEKL